MTEIDGAQLLIPAIRWDKENGYEGNRPHFELALELGCGGFIIFGGESAAVRDLTAELRERSRLPLLIASDLERGAGQQFAGATGLPPLAAIGSSDEKGAARRAGQLTAREALSLGINWVLAPVCDLDIEKSNPIIGTRAFGSDPAQVSALVAEWIDGCQATGAMACAKHFPGHGRTAVDSHAALPVVAAGADEMRDVDMRPFRAAIDAGVASVLSAHIAFPALDDPDRPATLSRRIMHDLLRTEIQFNGIIVTDAMIMDGVLQGRGETRACVEALAAGCDLVLYPMALRDVAKAVNEAVASGQLDAQEILASANRRTRWSEWSYARGDAGRTAASGDGSKWAEEFAQSCVAEIRGSIGRVARRIDLILVDDDVGGPYPPPSREPLREALERGGFDARWIERPAKAGLDAAGVVVALFGDIRSWKGRAGYSTQSVQAVARAIESHPDAIVLQFSHPRIASELPATATHIVTAWGGEKTMQQAAARWLAAKLATAL